MGRKPVILRKIWAHKATKEALAKYQPQFWLFDGRKLAWSASAIQGGQVSFSVDLDEGRKLTGNPDKRPSNVFQVTVKQTTEIHVAALKGYLDQKIQFNSVVQEALNFMDHLIREWPSQHLLAIKRNFYPYNGQGRALMDGSVVEVRQGTYASLRLSHNLSRGGVGLALNADVSNTCFWVARQTIDTLLCNYLKTCDRRWSNMRPSDLVNELRPVQAHGRLQSSDAFKQVRKLRKLRFTVRHSNRPPSDKVYSIQDIVFRENYGPEGATAKNVTFECDGANISVADYYAKKYKAQLKNPHLPLIDAGKGGFIPMEFAWVEPMQRYPFKLNPDQTAAMIKIAVTRPDARKKNIEQQVRLLEHSQDPILKHYGAHFEQQFTRTDGRVLQPPAVNFANGAANPQFSGRWDLRGKKFFKANVAPLQAWGFVVMDNCVQYNQLQQFARNFKQTFQGHGGICTADAMLIQTPGHMRNNVAAVIEHAHKEITRQCGYTQLVFVVVQHKNSPHYLRLKKSADCRFGILSQVVNGMQVAKNNGQYISNVCLKVNAKLGGATARTHPPWRSDSYFPKDRPTMVIGVDISHAPPGGESASTAAMTMSIDRDGLRYAAAVASNGYRCEMLTPSNVNNMFKHLSAEWKKDHDNMFPKHIIYFRDGVAEGQFAHVLEQEVSEMKAFFSRAAPNMPAPKFTVIVATKRHHVRLFPMQGKGDRNGNVLPGTLVERDVTHPFMLDFYLSSHAAIQGTARPVHYHVIMDEMGVPINDLQKMIYWQCYSYARSTTPVSLHPAVYYAHLACNRARAHEREPGGAPDRSGPQGHANVREREARGESGDATGADAPALIPLGGSPEEGGPQQGEMRQRDFFRRTMWYI